MPKKPAPRYRVTVCFTPALLKAVVEAAEADGRKLSDYVRNVIRLHTQKNNKAS